MSRGRSGVTGNDGKGDQRLLCSDGGSCQTRELTHAQGDVTFLKIIEKFTRDGN